MTAEVTLDRDRERRIGLPEAIFCEGKTAAQLDAILAAAPARLLLTRLTPERLAELRRADELDYDFLSRTAVRGATAAPAKPPMVAIVTAGTSDLPAATEAGRTLRFHGAGHTLFADLGVAGLWRLLEQREAIARHPVVIAAAGMEGALFSVLGGLVGSVVIALPTSNGYGVGAGGRAALGSALASCAPGVTVVNIDNGYGAACAALRVLRALGGGRLSRPSS